MQTPPVFGRLYKRGLDAARSNDRLTEWLWRVPVHHKRIPFTWDVTTLCLKKAIEANAPEGPFRFLDMGCGHLGLLGQYVKTAYSRAEVVSVDLYDEFVENARTNVRANGLDLDVHRSDLFADVEGRFDLITFNPPYKPDAGAPTLDFPATTFSGPDGLDASRGFLADAPAHLTERGRVLLGINCFFVPESACREVIEGEGFDLRDVVTRRLNTARVFVLTPRPRN